MVFFKLETVNLNSINGMRRSVRFTNALYIFSEKNFFGFVICIRVWYHKPSWFPKFYPQKQLLIRMQTGLMYLPIKQENL